MNEDMTRKEQFREWLASFEADEQPFQERCPIATWKQDDPEFKLYFESLVSDWMGKFILAVDYEMEKRTGWTNEWSSLTAKEALELLDSLELA